MAVQANIRPGYRARFGLIAVLLLGWGLYCLYDGLYAYPKYNEQVRRTENEVQRFKQERGEGWNKAWPEHARDEGYIENLNNLRLKGTLAQHIMAGVSLPLSLVAGWYYLAIGGRWVRSDEHGLRTHRGQDAPWETVRSLDKSRWQRKGVAVIHYDAAQAGDGRIVLDDWKYETEQTGQILRDVEAHLEKENKAKSESDEA